MKSWFIEIRQNIIYFQDFRPLVNILFKKLVTIYLLRMLFINLIHNFKLVKNNNKKNLLQIKKIFFHKDYKDQGFICKFAYLLLDFYAHVSKYKIFRGHIQVYFLSFA